MRLFTLLAGLVVLLGNCALAQSVDNLELKTALLRSVENQYASLQSMSDEIWRYAETALHESQSSELLADYAARQGFRVVRGIAGMPTAFIASFGAGRPVIGIVGEYDALPRLSQAATTTRQPLQPDAPGHGCGHNLYGVASLAAATAIKQLMEAGKLQGTIHYFGTPAEESIGGKTYMARDGLFSDLDVMVSWHPDSTTRIDVSGSQAMVETTVAFSGTASHAAFDPWNGRSALDGLELFTHSLNLLREHVRPSVRIHYSIIDGGGAPNVVPATASASVWIRDTEIDSVMQLLERMQVMAKGAAMAANVTTETRLVSGTYNMLNNKEAAKIAHANMLWLGPITYTDAETTFAIELQTAMGVPPAGLNGQPAPLELEKTAVEGGSTDLADVSWIVPTLDINVTTAPVDIPWHSWGVVASSGMSIGHRGMHYAAQVLGTTMIDLYQSPAAIDAINAEFREDTSGFAYRAYVPDGPPPLPEDR
ncbi:MAG: amidohydrolase [Gammaproteobacteria bacterium]|nr:amidohydrolase [Gammaproteobacteria bacterium]